MSSFFMPYDIEGKYYRKPVFNENFEYSFGRKRKNNKNSKIMDTITPSPSERDARVHVIWRFWHRLTTQKCIAADIKGY